MHIPWAEKHARFTLLFEKHSIEVLLASRNTEEARKLLNLNWHQVNSIMKRAVERGLESRDREEIPWLGMDEKSFKKGHKYISLLNDIEGSRVLEVVEGRDKKTAKKLLNKGLNAKQREMVCGVAIDMSAPFISAIRLLLPDADIVHDRFHISQQLNESVDKVRRQENRRLMKKNDDRLVGSKYLWLRGMEHMSDENNAQL
jgi:transposase